MRSTIAMPALALTLAGLSNLAAQEPPGWRWRLDRPAQDAPAGALRFEQMPPGFHVTTGPGVILYHPDEHAAGRFSLVADFVTFPETTDSGYGIFLGGSELEGENASWLAALLRKDGAVSLVRHAGSAEQVVVPWTAHPAIRAHPGSGVVTNRLRVGVSPDSVRVFVNDSLVIRAARNGAPTDGGFGFRIGGDVNVHITILDHVRHLAPARGR